MNVTVSRFQNIFSLSSRERCLSNLKKYRTPSWNRSTKVIPTTAAVLIPLCNINNQASLLYTVRSTNLRSHSGQVSFPGGKSDKGEGPVETALREVKEEIGLSSETIDIWGCGEQIPGKNSAVMITPVIGYIKDFKEANLSINESEVSEVFVVPIEILSNPKNQFYTQFQNGFILPVFITGNYKIWGVTAYITHMFLSCLLSQDIYRNEWMKKKITIK